MKQGNNIKKPISKGVAKVPVVIQLEALECGAACLTMILAYYNKWISLEKARIDCGVSRDGSNAVNILKAARNYGLTASGCKTEPEQLKGEGTFPCIIHWNFNHFVVLNGFKGGKAYLNDPAKGTYSISMEEFDHSFTGVCLMFEPSEEFEPSGKEKSIWDMIKPRLSGLKIPLIIATATAVLVSLLGIISPIFDRIFYDRLLTGNNPDWFYPFIIGLTALYIVELVVLSINTATSLKISGKLNVIGNLSYMWKVLHLPMNFFSQRMTGDIVSRQSGNAQIANTLVKKLAPLVINTAMMVFYLLVMIRYSWFLTIIGVISAIINMAVTSYITKRRINLNRVQSRDSAKLSATTVSGVQMIETIKSSGAEEGYFEKWAGEFAEVNNTAQKNARRTEFQVLIPAIVSAVTSNLVLGFGFYFIINGQFTVGALTAFQGFLSSFMSPVDQLIDANKTIQDMKTSMERIDDVMNYPDDPNIVDIEPAQGEEISKLSGSIEINNISFGYSPLADPLIKDFSMSIKQGDHVAFVGTSGCGKSTLSRLISGMYVPWNGEILFDGKHVNEIDHSVFTGSLAVVDQDITLFEDTISSNIKMWDSSIEDFEMILAAKDAQMHYDIVAKDGGYQHKLVEGGRDFSGGQRQRLEIARVLAQEPNIIILDEATSALDAKTEYNVVKSIKDRGITCIIIAHRLSTIRDCDEIVVLDRGRVVERGTHDELIKLDGYYTRLITNE